MINATSYVPSAMDLFLVVPRLAQRAGAYAFYYMPDGFDGLFAMLRDSGSHIAEATTAERINATITNATAMFATQAQDAASTAATAISDTLEEKSALSMILDNLKTFGGIFSYMSSKWAMTTILTAVLLNRTQFYASSRVPLRINWHVRFALYLPAIVALLYQIQRLLQGLRCQTSPSWDTLRYGESDQHFSFDFAPGGGFLHYLSSVALFWQSDAQSCAAVNMAIPDKNLPELQGSMSLLWPHFISLCISQFVETLACALQGRQPMPETGMTVFEHSLAFAEAETMVMRPFSVRSILFQQHEAPTSAANTLTLTRPMLMSFLNVPSEVILIALISSLSHLSSSVLAVAGLRHRYRLINTGVWGLAYMSAFTWTFVRLLRTDMEPGLMRFPTVCLVGFLPHLLILCGMIICGLIYGLAYLVTVASLPQEALVEPTITGRFRAAYNNLQANVNLSTGPPITIRWEDDFYTSLLKAGFTIMTAASDAVYLNESIRVRIARTTWLEQKRLDEISHRVSFPQREPTNDAIGELGSLDTMFGSTPAGTPQSHSGYATERKAQAKKGMETGVAAAQDRGVGFMQRHGRWTTAMLFLRRVSGLVRGLFARLVLASLKQAGSTYKPAWLTRFAGRNDQKEGISARPSKAAHDELDFWMLSEDGDLYLPADNSVDVEVETRRRLEATGALDTRTNQAEAVIDDSLYSWWKNGGWWGELDASGEYRDTAPDDDTTSMISMSTNHEESDVWTDTDNDEGRRTPTQDKPFPSTFMDPATSELFDSTELANMLDPQTDADKVQAKILARHLRNPGPMTRSQYRRTTDLERARILSAGHRTSHGRPTVEEQEQALEQYIISQREKARSGAAQGSTWDTGAGGMGAGGPACVVCQSSPRTIMAWPCGCLSCCDDCRIGLATRNFAACICCRTDVVSYSRLYVP